MNVIRCWSAMRDDAWRHFRGLTPARIALGRAGASLPTKRLLEFQLAHALARDAVHAPFDAHALALQVPGSIILSSRVSDRMTYLLRPDLGRRLNDNPLKRIDCDICIICSDGLSALAAQRQIPALLTELLPLLRDFSLAPICIVPFARVAIQDEIGHALCAKLALILLGERPGLGSPDSLGAYFVFDPKPGKTDADRNCVSNIRPQGLSPAAAAHTLHYLITQSLRRRLSGVALKDDRAPLLENTPAAPILPAPE